VDETDVTRSDIARALDVHRSVITRQLSGHQDMSLGRVAEIAWTLGYEPEFVMRRRAELDGDNKPVLAIPAQEMKVTSSSMGASERPASIKAKVPA
jgi:plasmid maintenance system antidote protein VapI